MGLTSNTFDKWLLNVMWAYIYLFNVWECLIEEWFDLTFNDDKGKFYTVCYKAFTHNLMFWKVHELQK